MTRVGIAIIGAGYMAQQHARAFASLPSVEIAGVCGRTRSRAEDLAAMYGAKVYDTVDSLYEATKADVVVIAVNELSMPDVCFAAFRYPWLCLLEKPVGVDLPASESILDRARAAGVRAYVALNRRSYSSTRQALQKLSGDDGPRLISLLDQEDMQAAREFGRPEAVVRNWMYANSIHIVDYFNVFGRGEIVSVVPTVPWTPEMPGNVVAVVTFSSGDTGVYEAVWDGPGPWSATITNRQVRAEMRPLEKLRIQRRGERSLTEIVTDPVDTEFKPGLRYQAEQMLAALEGKPASLATLEDAMRSMTLCAHIYGLSQSEFKPF
jgi:predicted dehydrogenase